MQQSKFLKEQKFNTYEEMKTHLSNNFSNISWPTGSLKAKIMFVGIQPSHLMTSKTKTNDVLLPIIDKYIGDDYYFTNVVKIPGEKNILPDTQLVNKFLDYLKFEINYIQPKIIFAMGNWVHLILEEKGVEHDKIRHPAFISRMGMQDYFDKQIKKILYDRRYKGFVS